MLYTDKYLPDEWDELYIGDEKMNTYIELIDVNNHEVRHYDKVVVLFQFLKTKKEDTVTIYDINSGTNLDEIQ